MAHPDLDNRKLSSGYNSPSSTTVQMGKVQPAHMGSQSMAPDKEDPSSDESSMYHNPPGP